MPKILIVDDESHIRFLLERTLETFEDRGVVLLTANDGIQALDIIKKELPDIVFLDIMMEEKKAGLEVCRKVKNELNLKDIFIIMVTAKGDSDENEAEQAGADMYLTKPFNNVNIIEKTEQILLKKLGQDWENK